MIQDKKTHGKVPRAEDVVYTVLLLYDEAQILV